MGVRNTLGALNDHLFAELERLGNEDLDAEQMRVEIERARAVTGVAAQVIANANTVLRAVEFKDGAVDAKAAMPRMLRGDD